MSKYKIVISLGVHTAVVDATDENEAIDKAGDEWLALLEGTDIKDIVEVYMADAEDVAAYEQEKAERATITP